MASSMTATGNSGIGDAIGTMLTTARTSATTTSSLRFFIGVLAPRKPSPNVVPIALTCDIVGR